jgi:hypothetical protein
MTSPAPASRTWNRTPLTVVKRDSIPQRYCALRATRYGLPVPRQREPGAKGRDLGVRVGAVVALAAAVALVAWLVVRHNDSNTPSAASTSTSTQSSTLKRPVVIGATAQSLRTLAAVVDHPIYWLGPRAHTTYELTQMPDGKVYIRYLPPGVKVGDRSGGYPLVGTYPVEDGYKAVQTAAKTSGAHKFKIPRGGLAVVNDAAPNNVYFAYPGTNEQIEVFDPNPTRARRLVARGAVRPIH